MKTISFNEVSNALSESEMKHVKGRLDEPMLLMDEGGSGLFGGGTPLPCPPPYRGCSGPVGTFVPGYGLCCLVPCNGWFHTYGYAALQGLSKCP